MRKTFTRLLILFLVAFIQTENGFAQRLITENFPVAGTLSDLGWSVHSGGTTSPIVTTSGGLSYPGILTDNVGFAAQILSVAGQDVNKGFTAVTGSNSSLYYSFLINVNEAGIKSGDYLLHIGNASNPTTLTTFAARLYIRTTASGVNFGITNGSTAVYSSTNYELNKTYLAIVKYTINPATEADEVRLWLKATGVPATEVAAGAPDIVETTINGQNTINAIALRQGSTTGPAAIVDGILVGTTWEQVTESSTSTTPALSVTGNATSLSTTSGTASASATLSLSGSNLTGFPGNITATASSTNFEVSNNNTSWGPSTTIAYSSATLAASNVYVRLSATAAVGSNTGTVTFSGGGATDVVTNVSGNATVAAPTTQATNIVVSAINDNGFTVNWTNGNGANRILVVRPTATAQVLPVDGSVYTTQIGSGNIIWYNGVAGGPITVTGLIPGTSYTVQVYEFNGSTVGSTNYLTTEATNNPVTTTTTGVFISNLLQKGYFQSISTPLYMAGGNTTRVPNMFVAKVSGLSPNTSYRYYINGAAYTDLGTTTTGAGIPIVIDYNVSPAVINASTTGGLNTVGSYGRFTTESDGTFSGTFGLYQSGNARFNEGSFVIPAIVIGEDIASSAVKYRFALSDSIQVLAFGIDDIETKGTFIKGNSTAPAGNVVALWQSADGNTLAAARPLSMTLVERIVTTSGAFRTNLISNYDSTAGAWNTIIPNMNGNGVRLIQQFSLKGALVGCKSSATGIWPSGANTVNPAGGLTAIQITAADASLSDISACAAVLPVSIVNFKATKSNDIVLLTWTTAQELNAANFVIERSTDNRTWNSIATIAATGNSSTSINYSYKDLYPARGINYYRLKQIDIDYKTRISAVRSILFSDKFSITIAPNPATDFVNVYINNTKQNSTQIIVSDVNGKIVDRKTTTDQQININTSRYAKGVYFIKVLSADLNSTQKIIVQ